MPTTLTEETITTLDKYTRYVESLRQSDDRPRWFRGSGRYSYALSPSLFRHPSITDTDELINLEGKILERFRQRCIPYMSQRMTENWEYLFLMQHFGVPTRLLDWTENPYMALFFALTTANLGVRHGVEKYLDNAAVWVLDPLHWNNKALSNYTYRGAIDILTYNDDKLKAYTPLIELGAMKEEPVAMFGTHNSPRIVAQRGVFTIFGRNIESMNSRYVTQEYPQDCLIKLKIPANKIKDLLDSIIAIGITDSVVFPDLDGLARETKRFFGYKVSYV